jgi:hypothetical protein
MFEPMESAIDRGRVRATIERLVAEGTAVSRADGSLHSLFPVAIPPAEGDLHQSVVLRTSRQPDTRPYDWFADF